MGVAGYNLYLSGQPDTPLNSSLITTTSYTYNGSLTAGSTYSFDLVAQDAAGNKSGDAGVSALIPTTNIPAQDQSSDQYIPQDWQNYFYNDLTATLRGKITQLPSDLSAKITIPYANYGWLHVPATGISGRDRRSNLSRIHPDRAATNVFFHDLNGNGYLDPGESAWISSPYGANGYVQGDTIVAGPENIPPGTFSTGHVVYYVGPNTDGTYDPSTDVLIPNPWLIQGQTGQYDYYDQYGLGYYASGDPVWRDSAGTHVFQTGETVISGSPQAGMWGKSNGIYSYTASSGGNSYTIVWEDRSTFQQDFSAFYTAVDQMVPEYANPSSSTPNETWNIGSFLTALGLPINTPAGTISVSQDGEVVTGDGTTFTSDVAFGDYMSINGKWYPVETVVNNTELLLGAHAPTVNGVAYSVVGWTKIPAETDASTGITFSFRQGQPDATSLIFPQQFQELENALNLLTSIPQYYGEWDLDSSTSQAYISTATEAINTAESIFGDVSVWSPETYTGAKADIYILALSLVEGDADPGSLYIYGDLDLLRNGDSYGLITELQRVVMDIEGVIYVRGDGINGWRTDPGSPNTAITFGDSTVLQGLLPESSDALSTRAAGGLVQSDSTRQFDANRPYRKV